MYNQPLFILLINSLLAILLGYVNSWSTENHPSLTEPTYAMTGFLVVLLAYPSISQLLFHRAVSITKIGKIQVEDVWSLILGIVLSVFFAIIGHFLYEKFQVKHSAN